MNNTLKSIEQGLDESIEYSKDNVGKAIVHELGPAEAKQIRANSESPQNELITSGQTVLKDNL